MGRAGKGGRGRAGHLKRKFATKKKGGASATKEKRKVGADVRDEDAIEGQCTRLEQEELFLERHGRKGANE